MTILRYFENALNQSLGLIRLNPEGYIIDTNELFCHLIKQSKQQVLGKSLQEVLSDQTFVKNFPEILQMLNLNTQQKTDVLLKHGSNVL